MTPGRKVENQCDMSFQPFQHDHKDDSDGKADGNHENRKTGGELSTSRARRAQQNSHRWKGYLQKILHQGVRKRLMHNKPLR